MAYTDNLKRRKSMPKSLECLNSTLLDQDLPYDEKLTQKKRQRYAKTKLENESSSDSSTYSNAIPSESERSSDSEFKEHPYSKTAIHFTNKANGLRKSRLKLKSDIGTMFPMSQCRSIAKQCERSKCTSKNAVMARLNRLKKKRYIEDLENKNSQLESENQMLKNMLDIKAKEVESLNRKTLNLENVIRNKTEIGSLLRCVRENTSLEISSSILRKESKISTQVNRPNQYSENSGSNEFKECELSPFKEECNEIIRPSLNSESLSPSIEFLDTIIDEDVNCGSSNLLSYDIDSLIKSSSFDLSNSPKSTGYEGVFSPSRCETPSKGFAVSANKENLFGDVGVCFHIANNKVSLEFCDSCNLMAAM